MKRFDFLARQGQQMQVAAILVSHGLRPHVGAARSHIRGNFGGCGCDDCCDQIPRRGAMVTALLPDGITTAQVDRWLVAAGVPGAR